MAGSNIWKTGRGKLGVFDPLIGNWVAEAETPMGPVRCLRDFARTLGDHYVTLDAAWELPGNIYREHAIFGVGDAKGLAFWSFTSDGKRSVGTIADATDIHPEALCFEAVMPAGLARMVYWPAEDGGFEWAAESREPEGWNRFVLHHYRRR